MTPDVMKKNGAVDIFYYSATEAKLLASKGASAWFCRTLDGSKVQFTQHH